MMLQEFIDRTGFEPTQEEYSKIEEAYYEFNGSKDDFCRWFVSSGGEKAVYQARAERIVELEAQLREKSAEYEARIARLQKQLDRELEWMPHESIHNVKQADYERLAADPMSRELADDEAADMIASEFGFDRSKIQIVHKVSRFEINRHRQIRRNGTYERKSLFNAWDWNYICFNVRGNCTMGYEMHNGELQMYWD